jgi:hypothetical protein
MTLASRDTETIASTLRRRGVQVTEPRADNLREELAATLDRLRAGETFAELSRRDPEALCSLAMERRLTEHEALMLLAAVRYRDALLTAADRSIAAERDWARCQRENAELWAKDCAELGKAMGTIAGILGLAEGVLLEQIVESVKQHVGGWTSAVRRGRVCELLDLASAFSIDPCEIDDPTTSMLVRASNELGELRELARSVSALLGEPGLEQEPDRLLSLLVERIAVEGGPMPPDKTNQPSCSEAGCDVGPECPWSPYEVQR